MMDQKRITYIPQPPSLKCFQTAAIEPSSVNLFVGAPQYIAEVRLAWVPTSNLRANPLSLEQGNTVRA
jgi:hypothetical protein